MTLLLLENGMGIRSLQKRGRQIRWSSPKIMALLIQKVGGNTIEQGDFDKDGDMDYIIGNFGRNSLKTSIAEPVWFVY